MSSVRTFLITLAVSLMLFGVVAYYATGFVMDMVYPDSDIVIGNEHSPDSETQATTKGIVNLLLVCTDQYIYRPSPGGAVESQFNQIADAELREHTKDIVFLTLVSFNSITKQVMITALPGNLLVTASGQEVDLDTAYYFTQNGLHGLESDFFVQSISSLLGIQVDYTTYVDIDQYVDVADNLGGLSVNCPEDFPTVGIAQGEQTLSSDQLYKMLTADYTDPANKTLFIAAQCKAILDRITDRAHEESLYADFERISQVMESDFGKPQLATYKNLIFNYRNYKTDLPLTIGTFIESGDELYYRPDRSATQNLFKQYK